MTSDQAIAAAKQAFGERDVAIDAARGILRVTSNTHAYDVALSYNWPGMGDEVLTDQLLPDAVQSLDAAIASGRAPLRAA